MGWVSLSFMVIPDCPYPLLGGFPSTFKSLSSLPCTLLVRLTFEIFVWNPKFFIYTFISVWLFFSDSISNFTTLIAFIILLNNSFVFSQTSLFISFLVIFSIRYLNIFISAIFEVLVLCFSYIVFLKAYCRRIPDFWWRLVALAVCFCVLHWDLSMFVWELWCLGGFLVLVPGLVVEWVFCSLVAVTLSRS